MQLLVFNKSVHELEELRELVHGDLYYCKKARDNENQLKEIIEEVNRYIVYLRSYTILFGSSFLSKNLLTQCQVLVLETSEDLSESERVHIQD